MPKTAFSRLGHTCSRLFLPNDIGEAIAPGLAEHIMRRPLVQLIDARLGIVGARAVQVSSATAADAEIGGVLEVHEGAAVLMLLRTCYSTDSQAFEHVRLYGRPALYSHVVEFTRDRR